MSAKIKYSDEPLGEVQAIPDFLPSPGDLEVDAAWDEVIRKRIAEIESGAVKPIPADEVFERVRRTLR